VKILNKQSRTVDKGQGMVLQFGSWAGLTNPDLRKDGMLRNVTQDLGMQAKIII
jgi:hypothetical protein